MKEVYSHEFNWWQKILQKTLGMWRINRDSIDFKWGYFAPRFGFEFVVNRGGYFDSNYSLSFCFIWGHLNVKLPFNTRLAEGCDLPKYGIAIHNNTAWLYYGGKYDESWGQVTGNSWYTWDLPFVTQEFESHEIQRPDGWVTMGKGYNETPDPWDFRQTDARVITETFTADDGTGSPHTVTATYTIERRTWHRKWLPFLKMSRYVLDISFDKEVGPGIGSWKGGTTGLSSDMKPGEPHQPAFWRIIDQYRYYK